MQITSPFRNALLKSIEGKRNLGRFGAQVKSLTQQGVGTGERNDWTANLSYRTALALKNEGVL